MNLMLGKCIIMFLNTYQAVFLFCYCAQAAKYLTLINQWHLSKWSERSYHMANPTVTLGYLIVWLTSVKVQWSKAGEILSAVCDNIFVIRTVYAFLAPSLIEFPCISNGAKLGLNFLYLKGSKISSCVSNTEKLWQDLKT